MKTAEEFLKHEVDSKQSPSVQYAFFNADTIYRFHYGLKNVRKQSPVDDETTYNLFSTTKTFTALSVLQLAEQGKVDLNKPVAEYLPDFPYDKAIAIKQLLTHTSGIPNPLPLRWTHLTSEQNFNRNLFFSDIFKKNKELKSTPGAKFKYSNLGYVLLGQLIEKLTGQTYESYVQENILKKSGIDNADLGFIIDSNRHSTGYQKRLSLMNAALGFMINKDKVMGEVEGGWKPFHNFYINGTSYGGLIGTADGMVKYGQALLRDSLLSSDYKKILFTENVIDSKPTGMAMSWFTGTFKGNKYVAHAGGGGGYYIEIRLYPDLKAGSVIIFNRSGMSDERILDKPDAFFIRERSKQY